MNVGELIKILEEQSKDKKVTIEIDNVEKEVTNLITFTGKVLLYNDK